MTDLVSLITAPYGSAIRDHSLDGMLRGADVFTLVSQCEALDAFRKSADNLYERVRAQFFLYAIHRFHLPLALQEAAAGSIPFEASESILNRRFELAVAVLLREQAGQGPSLAVSSALAAAYYGLAFQTLTDQVHRSVQSVGGNQWMSRIGHPADYPLSFRREMFVKGANGLYPILRERTPVRMDLSHSAWSDIFFLAMDYPEAARVLNVSIDLSVNNAAVNSDAPGAGPEPPVEAWLRVIEEPVLRLTSIDLGASADITSIGEVFDFARDYLGLLKAAAIASGIVPQAMEGSSEPLVNLLERLVGRGLGIELVSRVRDIPKGSRLAVSTNLLASLISVCMRATSQIKSLVGTLEEGDKKTVAARAILGEWLGGSGGGWQDSGGVWPGMKLISGVNSGADDPEYGVSRGRLLPNHQILSRVEIPIQANLQESLILVHGGMAQDVGPILEMVTEKYLLRSEKEWAGRKAALAILDDILVSLGKGDLRGVAQATERNFFGPIQTIIPWASNFYTETLIRKIREEFGDRFWGFWMLGGMSGGGMGFIFDPTVKKRAQESLRALMRETKRQLQHAVPFAMDPVVYDFRINENGTFAEFREQERALMPQEYYDLVIPALLRTESRSLPPLRRAELNCFADACRNAPEQASIIRRLFDRLLPEGNRHIASKTQSLEDLLSQFGFDRVQHEQIQHDFRTGRIGLAQNRLPGISRIEDVPGQVMGGKEVRRWSGAGVEALREGRVAVVTLAGGLGTRWTRGSGAIKALNPFCKLGGTHRTFLEVHLAKSRWTGRLYEAEVPHLITTSFLTDAPMRDYLDSVGWYGYKGPVSLSPGRSIGLRFVPMKRDLQFLWEEMSQQVLDEQKQKMRDSLRSAYLRWAESVGEGSDYVDNSPMQCLHPTGHWYEVPNLLRNGSLRALLLKRPQLRYLMLHNVDTLGASLDPDLLGSHIGSEAAMTFEVIGRQLEDRGGGLAQVDGRVRLVEGLAFPDERIESTLTYYNTGTTWIDIDKLLGIFDLRRSDLGDEALVGDAVRRLGSRMPTYITIKEVKKRWGKGQEDIYPVAQFEKLWGDMTALSDLDCQFVAVSRYRGQQMKEPGQLDGWLRDGSAEHIEGLCAWD